MCDYGVIVFLKHDMKNWKIQLTLRYESGTLMPDNINIKREVFQGDALSPLSSAFHSNHSHWRRILQAMNLKSELSGSPISFIWMI